MSRFVGDVRVARRGGGRVLIGGDPVRVVRLTEKGAQLADAWMMGDPVGAASSERALAERLVKAGILHPVAEPVALDQVTVVIPVRDDTAAVVALVQRLAGVPIVVVDDGSTEPIDDFAAAHVQVLRREVAGGPGVARMAGLSAVATPLVAFVDADVALDPDDLAALGGHFGERSVAAAAPRVAGAPSTTSWGMFDEVSGPLDLGPDPALVGPGRRVSYVPSAVLMARTDVIRAAGGFDPDLRYGEDVDLVWRLVAAGHQVRYDPSVKVHHRPRPTFVGWLKQRVAYGSAAAPLAQRHGDAVAPARLSPLAMVAMLAGWYNPRLRTIGVLAGAVPMVRRLRSVPEVAPVAFHVVRRGAIESERMSYRAVSRVWWPLLVPGLRSSRVRRLVGTALVGSAVDRVRAPGRRLDPIRSIGLAAADDFAYSIGVWSGVIRRRTLRPLMPAIVRSAASPSTGSEVAGGDLP